MRLATRFFIQLLTAYDRAERSAPARKYAKHARAGRVSAHGSRALPTTNVPLPCSRRTGMWFDVAAG